MAKRLKDEDTVRKVYVTGNSNGDDYMDKLDDELFELLRNNNFSQN
jgi:hypothetical protein